MNFIDLFAGTGAFSYVLEKNGFTCVFANDMIQSSQKIYELNNYHKVFKLKDMNNLDVQKDIPRHQIMTSGFLCQPFSISGKQLGFQDERTNSFWKMIEILKFHKPEIIILENVKNLQSHDNGNTFKIIMENLTSNGYHVKTKILDTCKITKIPQHRERIYIVGFLNQEKYNLFNFNFPIVENVKISELLEENIPDKYYYHERLKVYNTVKESVIKHINENTIYQYRRYYVRDNKSNCCPTLTANMGGGGHNVPLLRDNRGIRKLTPRECFNLQGFPRDYKLPKDLSDSALYQLAGNAISVPVVELIVEKLKQII